MKYGIIGAGAMGIRYSAAIFVKDQGTDLWSFQLS